MITHDELNDISMKIILLAGDARNEVYQALDLIENNDHDQAELHLKQARTLITSAHQAQTEAIQSEARGDSIPYSPLFTHAQDTLMTIMSEINLVHRLNRIVRTLERQG